MITLPLLIACGVRPTQARQFAEPLAEACARFEIFSREQIAAFLAQCMHESSAFVHLEEDLYYTNPVRVCELFRSGFDLNRDRRIDASEIEFAKAYTRNPKALANRAYANRNGNGDEASGDGWRFRGRGGFQLTGRANYSAASASLGVDLVAAPELVAQPTGASLTSAWYWASTGCNDMMLGGGDFDTTTLRINGRGMVGAKERRDLFESILRVPGL